MGIAQERRVRINFLILRELTKFILFFFFFRIALPYKAVVP